MEKRCLQCNKIIKGRIDKKFCTDSCRVSFNNKRNVSKSDYIKNINSILLKNRKILSELANNQYTRISKFTLLQKGFNFYFYTNNISTPTGENYFYCYDYGYQSEKNDHIILVKEMN